MVLAETFSCGEGFGVSDFVLFVGDEGGGEFAEGFVGEVEGNVFDGELDDLFGLGLFLGVDEGGGVLEGLVVLGGGCQIVAGVGEVGFRER